MPNSAPITAPCRLASANTMFGDFPPSSSEIFFTLLAAARITCCPTSVEPVNATLSTSGEAAIRSPTVLPDPVTTFTTPAGAPASVKMRPSSYVVHGVYVAGLITQVQPTANAGASFHVASSIGKFHGVMIPTTPTGSLRIIPIASLT